MNTCECVEIHVPSVPRKELRTYLRVLCQMYIVMQSVQPGHPWFDHHMLRLQTAAAELKKRCRGINECVLKNTARTEARRLLSDYNADVATYAAVIRSLGEGLPQVSIARVTANTRRAGRRRVSRVRTSGGGLPLPLVIAGLRDQADALFRAWYADPRARARCAHLWASRRGLPKAHVGASLDRVPETLRISWVTTSCARASGANVRTGLVRLPLSRAATQFGNEPVALKASRDAHVANAVLTPVWTGQVGKPLTVVAASLDIESRALFRSRGTRSDTSSFDASGVRAVRPRDPGSARVTRSWVNGPLP